MKKIGILYGMEQAFPKSVMEYINNLGEEVSAEFIKFGVPEAESNLKYNVIFDRASHEIPFYRSILKLSQLSGTQVVNNPFRNCENDNFLYTALISRMGIRVPRTVLLPSKEHPSGTGPDNMRNMLFPLDWDEIFEYIGFPAVIKPNSWSNSHNTYKVYNRHEFFSTYDITGSNVMMLQEAIDYNVYFRCFVIGRKNVKIVDYDPHKPHFLRYAEKQPLINRELAKDLEKMAIKISNAIDNDFNIVEFAVKDNIPTAIEYVNPAPTLERQHIHEENFNWLIQTTAQYLIECANNDKYQFSEYKWNKYIKNFQAEQNEEIMLRRKTKKNGIHEMDYL